MKQRIEIAVGVLLIFFLGFLTLAYLTIYNPELIIPHKAKQKEGFESAPTRASDCRCLEGYIPSNTLQKTEHGGRFLTNGSLLAFQPQGSNTKHLVSNCLVCEGVNPCSEKKVTVSKAVWDSLPWGSLYSCSLLTQAKSQAKTVSETFFCQSLHDPQLTRSCY